MDIEPTHRNFFWGEGILMLSPNIRQASGSDMPYLYEICLKTGMSGLDATDAYNDPLMLGHYYAAPYLWKDPSLCFIATDDDGVPSGYIVGTDDTESFNDWLNDYWLPPLRRRYQQDYQAKTDYEQALCDRIRKGPGAGVWENVGYRAHLHIDLLPNLQGKGLGKALMKTWLGRIADKGVSGVHLGVDGRNINAFGFYERMGFTILERPEWGAVYGLMIESNR